MYVQNEGRKFDSSWAKLINNHLCGNDHFLEESGLASSPSDVALHDREQNLVDKRHGFWLLLVSSIQSTVVWWRGVVVASLI